MTTLADALKSHVATTNTSVREIAERIGVSYPSLLAWTSKGGVPRSAEHREALRRELAMPTEEFARLIAASQREPVAIPGEGPLDLRQLVLQYLYQRGLTERTFADLSGIPYATIIGITKHGSVPRAGTIEQLADKLGMPVDDVRAAATRTHGIALEMSAAEATATGQVVASEAVAEPTETYGAPAAAAADEAPGQGVGLARLVAERIAASGLSAAAWARTHGVSYLVLSSMLSSGQVPEDETIVSALRAAVAADQAAAPPVQPRPRGRRPLPSSGQEPEITPTTPMHAAILALVRERGFNQAAFAKAADITALTAAKLIKKGELPGREKTHAKMRALLGLDETAYADLLDRSRPDGFSPPPAPPQPVPEEPPKHPLHEALRALVRERGMNQGTFSKALDVSALTGAKLLKGELPGREKTHAKLRVLLGLDEAAYDDLIRRSSPEVPGKAPRGQKAAQPEAEPVDPEVAKLSRAIKGLDDEQRSAVWKLIKTYTGE
jgi:transcriptional regulator with XRE-family HTH domain